MSRRAVFLDKDGTLVENMPFNIDPAKIFWTPNAAAALRLLYANGFHLFIISNQPGIAYGYFAQSAVDAVMAEMARMFGSIGLPLAGFYYCPHHPDGKEPEFSIRCDCRKPEPGLVLQAAKEHGIDLSASWLIGDILDDIEAGRRAGCRAVLLDNGNESEWCITPLRWPDGTASDLEQGARYIIAQDRDLPMSSGTLRTCGEGAYG